LRYYSSIGATQFECALHNGDRNPLYEQIINLKSLYNLNIRASVICDIDQYHGTAIVPALNNIRKEYVAKYGWYCIADLDEFHYFGGKSIPEIIKEAEQRGYDAVHGVFFDRIAADGTFPEIDETLDNTFPLVCDLTRFSGLYCQKIVLAKSHIEIDGGHHSAKANIWRDAAEVHHFKWSKGADKVVENAYKRRKKQALRWEAQMLILMNLVKNKIDITNPQLNVRSASIIGI
jgi:hypothetical protein